jgi:hypothetical protein
MELDLASILIVSLRVALLATLLAAPGMSKRLKCEGRDFRSRPS